MASSHNVFHDGKVHVQRHQCSTCIFGRKSPVGVERREQMRRDADAMDGCIPCHHTLDGPEQAICRGYFDNGSSALMQMADRLGYVELVQIDYDRHDRDR